jgi:uncharacterized protein YyaL (SSP411 family)
MTMHDEFRFSPRPNRAAEIGWMPWGEAAFERARREDKPILLSISAVWCHWCHVMDETSYSDPAAIEAIRRDYVPVRVDNDRRPDVNARYNMGGWPTTAFLSPNGALLTGATYLAPVQMQRALSEIARFYAENKAAIAQAGSAPRPAAGNAEDHVDTLDAEPVERLTQTLRDAFDEEYGGFGDAPKFPQPETLEFLWQHWRLSGDESARAMVTKTILGMARGGTYDHVEGGFFRYSTTRDWSVPHFEKMAEDHAGLLRVLATMLRDSPTQETREVLRSAAAYVRTTLRDPHTGLFGGSQDADEQYFALPLERRRELQAPYVDRTTYVNWTCALAGAWCWIAAVMDDEAFAAEAVQTLDAVHERFRDDDGLLYHFATPGGAPQVRGLLTDQAAYLRALLDGHETTGEWRFLERATAMADRILERFGAEGGGWYDRLPLETLGRLDVPDRPIVDNGIVAESLLRLAALAARDAYRTHAEKALRSYTARYRSAGPFAATYARALERILTPEVTVRIVGEPAATAGLREAAWRLPGAVNVQTVAPGQAAALGLPQTAGAAYVCRGTVCGASVTDPAKLRASLDAMQS